jgi:hypothetical protein
MYSIYTLVCNTSKELVQLSLQLLPFLFTSYLSPTDPASLRHGFHCRRRRQQQLQPQHPYFSDKRCSVYYGSWHIILASMITAIVKKKCKPALVPGLGTCYMDDVAQFYAAITIASLMHTPVPPNMKCPIISSEFSGSAPSVPK